MICNDWFRTEIRIRVVLRLVALLFFRAGQEREFCDAGQFDGVDEIHDVAMRHGFVGGDDGFGAWVVFDVEFQVFFKARVF